MYFVHISPIYSCRVTNVVINLSHTLLISSKSFLIGSQEIWRSLVKKSLVLRSLWSVLCRTDTLWQNIFWHCLIRIQLMQCHNILPGCCQVYTCNIMMASLSKNVSERCLICSSHGFTTEVRQPNYTKLVLCKLLVLF